MILSGELVHLLIDPWEVAAVCDYGTEQSDGFSGGPTFIRHNLLTYTLPNHQNISTTTKVVLRGKVETVLKMGAI